MDSGESVYSLIPPPKEEIMKSHMYKSRFHQQATVPPSCSTFGLQGTTKVTSNEAGEEQLRPTMPKGQRDRSVRKAPIVRRVEAPVMGLTTDRNFVKENAVEAMNTASTKRPKEDTLAVQRGTYGKVPPYLRKVKQQVAEEYAMMNSMNQGNVAAQVNRMAQLTEAERAELLTGLRKKWEEIHKQYQKLTFSVDTVAKVQRKEGLEVEMEQIEKAIQKLSKKNVYVYNDMI